MPPRSKISDKKGEGMDNDVTNRSSALVARRPSFGDEQADLDPSLRTYPHASPSKPSAQHSSFTSITNPYLTPSSSGSGSGSSYSRPALQNLLRDPGSVTLAPSPRDRASPLDSESESERYRAAAYREAGPAAVRRGGDAGQGHGYLYASGIGTRDQSSTARPDTFRRPISRTSSGAKVRGSPRSNMQSGGDDDQNWGFPPPSPFQPWMSGGAMLNQGSVAVSMRSPVNNMGGIQPGEGMGMGQAQRRASVGPAGGFASGSGLSYGAGSSTAAASSSRGAASGSGVGSTKRRRESEGGSAEPDDEARPLAITCAPCRSRKIKCDSKKPTCGNCVKSPAECFYPVKQKPGLRPGTGLDMVKRMENLEDRVATYEARLAEQETRLAQLQTTNITLDPMMRSSFSAPSQPPAQPPPTFSQSPLAPSILQNLPNPMELPTGLDLGSLGPSASPSGLSSHSFRDPQVLPPDDIVRDLIALFFTHVHPWAPIISPTLPSFSSPWSIVVHAMVVVTLRYSSDPRLAATKDAYHRAAKQHVLAHAIESTSISSVQALALLALDLIGSEQGPASWGLLALLTRSAIHLGLGTEEDASGLSALVGRAPAPSLSRTSIIPPPANWVEDESRRRLFWLIFCLDRYACVSTGWEFAIPDFEAKRRLPCSDDIWANQEWYFTPPFQPVLTREIPIELSALSPLAFLVEALDLCGRAHTLQSQVVEPGDSRGAEARKETTSTLTSAAQAWFATLPIHDAPQTGLTLMIQAIHHATLLKLNAYYAFPALSNGDPQQPYTDTCLASCRAVAALNEAASAIGWMTAATPLFVWSSWVAARVSFVHAFFTHQAGPDREFDVIVASLKEQALYWGLANQYVKLLERAKRKWQAASSDPPNPNLPDAIHVLLDLRRTAYSAVTTAGAMQETPHVSPPDVDLSYLPAWAVQPLLGDLHNWFDLPAGLFQADM